MSLTRWQINYRLILLCILDLVLLPKLKLTSAWKLGIRDIEKSSLLHGLQFEIPLEIGVIKRPSVIEEVGITGLSGQTVKTNMITEKI